MKLTALRMAAFLLAGPVLVALAADDLETAYQQLKDAQAKADAVQVKKLAAEVHELACEVIATPAPQSAEDKEAWAAHVENAKSADLFSEYSLFATAIQSQPATLVDLISTLEQQNPKSKYLNEAYGSYLAALVKTGASAKVPGVAEKALPNFPENEDLLVLMTNTAMSRKQSDRALAYANRLVAALNKHSRPDGVSAADWERKKGLALAQGYWTAGVISGEKGQYMVADKNLRAALPLIKGNDAMMGPALFYLGMANYQIGKMTMAKARIVEGARFSEQAAAIQGPYMDQARHNALVMKAEADKMR